MRKRDELADPDSCLGRAEDDEPLFILRAKDGLSSTTVRAWADYAAKSGLHEREKIDEARMCADTMDNWRTSKGYDREA